MIRTFISTIRAARIGKESRPARAHWRRAAELAPTQAGRLADLAKFLARQGRHQESDEAFAQAEKIASSSAPLKFERAKTYIQAGRNQQVARRLLEEYLNSSLTPDDPPRAEAQRLLEKLSRSG